MKLRSLIPVSRDRNLANAFNPFLSLQREVEQLFDDFTRGWPAAGNAELAPSTDVTENDKDNHDRA